MKKFLSILLVLFSLGVSACNTTGNPSGSQSENSSESQSSESTSKPSESESNNNESESETNSESTGHGVPGVDDYEAWLDSWSEEGHLYIHYDRPGASESDYDKYAVWIWPNAPLDLEGSLWGATRSETQEKFTVMSTSWMTNIGGKGINKDSTGKILDIDLTRTDIKGGESGNAVSFEGTTRVGFLIVDTTTMGGGAHWVSDGGKNMYIDDFQTHWRAGSKSMHIFCTQGSVDEFTFESGHEPTPNPTVTDTTGMYRSKSDVESSKDIQGISKTSEKFKDVGVGYQIFVASYRDSNGDGLGDIRGIIDALPELDDMGIEALWLTPVQESESYHAYDTVDFFSIDHRFGTIEDYRELIYKAHKAGISVLMDLVLNHTSKNNVWFKYSQKALTETDENGNTINYRDLYHWKYKGDKVKKYKNGTWVDVKVEDHGDWYKDGESNYYYYGKFGSSMPELNYDCQLTRDLVKDLAKYWLGFGLDGFRLDAVKHIYMRDEVDTIAGTDTIVVDTGSKRSYDPEVRDYVTKEFDYSSDITKNLNFWKDFAFDVKSTYPDCFLVGENFDGYGMRIAPYYQALDSQFDFSLYYHVLENGYSANAESTSLGTAQNSETVTPYSTNSKNDIWVNGSVAYQLPGGNRSDFINSAFTSNHDILRAINHVNGDSKKIIGTEVELNKAKVAAAMTILNPGVSWIYYGDELGMSSNTDKHIELYKYENNVDLWYRQPYKWSNESVITDYEFNGYKVEWDSHNASIKSYEEQNANPNDGDMLDVYKQLIAIKNNYGKNATYKGYYMNDHLDVYHFVVDSDNGSYGVFINTGNKHSKSMPVEATGTYWFVNNGGVSNELRPYGVYVKKL